jgi:hypothetical protein
MGHSCWPKGGSLCLASDIAQIVSQENEFIQLQNPPDEDCSIYSKLYLRGEKI